MNATWNSEPLFTAFASCEDDETIVDTAEDCVTVTHADSEDIDDAEICEARTVEIGNVVFFAPGGTVEVLQRRGMDKSQKWLIRELDGLAQGRRNVSSYCWDALPKLPVARAMAQRQAGTPLFLAA